MNITDHILRLAARTIGVSGNEAAATDTIEARRYARVVCCRLTTKGKLYSAQLGPKSVRYFTVPEFRDAYLLAFQQEERERAEAALRHDDGFRAAWAPDVEAIVPKGLRVKRGPAFEPRFQQADRILPGIVSFGLQRGRVTIEQVNAAIGFRGRK